MSGLRFTRPFTVLGILLALLVIAAFVLVALNAQNNAASPSMNVVVATRDLQPRVAITADSLQLMSIPVPGNYPKVYFTRLQDVVGLVPLVTIPSGQAVTSNVVAKPSAALGTQSEFLPIPSGYVAVTIPTSEQQGVANYIQPEDYISVIATVATAGKVATKTIFTNLHVIRVGMAGGTAGSASNATSLTVVVTECQAEVITWFLDYAALKYVLESFHDYLQPGAQSPDPGCPTVTAAKGVTLQVIQAAYPSLF
ncbi:MAG TPA: Flp pilus assembly protein CpaB [Candidatus Acidoferrum sp.]|jgi:Flp pilus assembly protein CpaB|nr:Flp pilus assembly protein CpaB [Candidatus Acidoferrum sp.]